MKNTSYLISVCFPQEAQKLDIVVQAPSMFEAEQLALENYPRAESAVTIKGIPVIKWKKPKSEAAKSFDAQFGVSLDKLSIRN